VNSRNPLDKEVQANGTKRKKVSAKQGNQQEKLTKGGGGERRTKTKTKCACFECTGGPKGLDGQRPSIIRTKGSKLQKKKVIPHKTKKKKVVGSWV